MATGKKIRIQMFGENKIALTQEVKNHPTLLALLANHPVGEWELHLAEIAAYCNVALDDLYTEEDVEKICGILVHRLRKKRQIIITTH